MDEGTDRQPPKVFVSYSWDTTEHSNWVLRLATRLQADGVDITLDQWDVKLGDDVAYFMEKAAKVDSRVLAIVSTAYVTKTNEPAGGAGYEKRLITQAIMKDLTSDRLVPVLRENRDGELPAFMGTPVLRHAQRPRVRGQVLRAPRCAAPYAGEAEAAAGPEPV